MKREQFLILILTPIFFAILFGAIYSKNVMNQIPTAILDQDQSKLSRNLSRMFYDSDSRSLRKF